MRNISSFDQFDNQKYSIVIHVRTETRKDRSDYRISFVSIKEYDPDAYDIQNNIAKTDLNRTMNLDSLGDDYGTYRKYFYNSTDKEFISLFECEPYLNKIEMQKLINELHRLNFLDMKFEDDDDSYMFILPDLELDKAIRMYDYLRNRIFPMVHVGIWKDSDKLGEIDDQIGVFD